MTARSGELAARIDSISQLGSVIGALRSIATAQVQRSHAYVDGVRSYADTVGSAIAHALALLPPYSAPVSAGDGAVLVLFCAEQGFAGAFTQGVFEVVGERLRRDRLLIVGRRGQRSAAAQGLEPLWSVPGIAHVGGAAGLADRIAAELLRLIRGGKACRVDIVYTRPLDGSGLKVECLSLLPLDLHRFSVAAAQRPPLVQLPPALLLQQLAIEYLHAQLTEAVLLSFAAENTARMVAMNAARDNIRRTLESLQREARVARQEAITEELLELAGGML